jgi:hypothetical protein
VYDIPLAEAGWYPDPSGAPGQRYFDGRDWTGSYAPPAVRQPAGVVTEGPNHALHAILTLLTFWACGGWVWIWLLIALSNKKRVRIL